MVTGYRPVTDPERLRTFFGVNAEARPPRVVAGTNTKGVEPADARRKSATPIHPPPGSQLQLPFSDDASELPSG